MNLCVVEAAVMDIGATNTIFRAIDNSCDCNKHCACNKNIIPNVTFYELNTIKHLKYLIQHHNVRCQIKKLSLVNCSLKSATRESIDELLQILIPLSPKEIELKNRLSKEITNEIKNNLTIDEIQKLEERIKNQVYEENEKKFDENELTYHDNDDKKMQEEDKNNVVLTEMLSLDHCEASSTQNLIDFIGNTLTIKRLQSSLTNLKALDICGISKCEHDIFGEICTILLNNICNQLESLHIDDDLVGLKKWKFVENNYTDINDGDQYKQSWFPSNITHLCVYSQPKLNDNDDEDDDEDEDDSIPFWHCVSSHNFPKLQHLRVSNVSNDCNNEHLCHSNAPVVSQFAGLIKNGLKSFYLTLQKLEMRDLVNEDITPEFFDQDCLLFDERKVFPLLSFLNNFCQLLQCSCNPCNKDMDEFILKLKLQIDLPTYHNAVEACNIYDAILSCKFKQEFVKLLNQILMIFVWLKYVFRSAMLCFKMTFDGDETMLGAVQSVCNSIVGEQVSMKSDSSRVVDAKVRQRGRTLWFAVVWKNFVTAAPNIPYNCVASHCEPQCAFCCDLCKPTSWL